MMKKGLVFGIVVLFIGAGITSCAGVNVEKTNYLLNIGELAWWKFDETSGNTAHDSSGHGYDGTVYGATWTGGGLSFDGVDDYVDFDAHSEALGINKTDDYFVFVRFESTASGMLYSMSHTNSARAYLDLMLDSDGKISVIMGDETCTFDLSTSGNYNDGDWHLLEMEFYGDTVNPTLNLYVDGELDATTTEWLCPMLDEDFLTAKVGRDSNVASDYFDGEIDDIKVYKSYPINHPPEAPTVDGPTSPKPGQTITYTFNAEDPDFDYVRFHIDWGDGDTETTTYVESGGDQTASHAWSEEGTYYGNVKAEDEHGAFGDETEFTIIVKKSKPHQYIIPNFLQSYPSMYQLPQKLLFSL